MCEIMDVTGAGVFNHVVEIELPVLKKYKEMNEFLFDGNKLSENDDQCLHFIREKYLGLANIIFIGSENSWRHTR